MKKVYIKPDMEIISLITEEKITTEDALMNGELGIESAPADWQ